MDPDWFKPTPPPPLSSDRGCKQTVSDFPGRRPQSVCVGRGETLQRWLVPHQLQRPLFKARGRRWTVCLDVAPAASSPLSCPHIPCCYLPILPDPHTLNNWCIKGKVEGVWRSQAVASVRKWQRGMISLALVNAPLPPTVSLIRVLQVCHKILLKMVAFIPRVIRFGAGLRFQSVAETH